MQYNPNETAKMAGEFCDMLKKKFGDRVDDISIFRLVDDQSHREFSISFVAYEYYTVGFNYERGSFGCFLDFGRTGVNLNSSQKWWDTADFDIFFDDLERELELRIPDKFLKARGWYKKPKGWFKD